MDYRAALTRVSMNVKTGPIPVSTTESKTCPKDCVQKETCYAKYGHLSLHWKAIDKGERGMCWEDFCDAIRGLPRGQFWRHNQAGDLPGDGENIDKKALEMLVRANKRRKGFTYTHYPLSEQNIALIDKATNDGFTVNVSCDSLIESDRLYKLSSSPQVVVLPSTTTEHIVYTPRRRRVVVCPATYRKDVTCSTCQICYESSPYRAIIGFPAHGAKKKVIDIHLKTEVA